jgi:uncharacterized SAM-binding protein YcdF (DUF218 family)
MQVTFSLQPLNSRSSPVDPQPRPKRIRRRVILWSCGFVFLFCFLLAAFCFVFRSPLLRLAANAWLVNDAPVKADAIVLLGGGIDLRPYGAADLYQQGLAQRILIMNSELKATDRDELTIPWCEMAQRVLRRHGVPASAIEVAGTNLTSTYEEACTVRDWCQRSQARVLLIPNGPFNTRRAKWLFQKVLRPSGVEVRVLAMPSDHFSDWWRHEDSLIDFNNELVKFALYLWRY